MKTFPVFLVLEVEREGKHWSASLIAAGPPCEREVSRLTRDPERYSDSGRRTLMHEFVYGETEEEAASNLMLLFRDRFNKLLDPEA